MADNQMNDATSFQQAEVPILCAKGCGFFGTSSTMNMCSKCYRDHRMAEENAASAKIAVEKSLSSPLVSPAAIPKLIVSEGSSSTAVVAAEETVEVAAADAAAKVKAKNRCGCCNKKVGVVGFECRCGITFCGSHRYPEEHKCTFDYVEAGKKAIAKANPVIKADKINRF